MPLGAPLCDGVTFRRMCAERDVDGVTLRRDLHMSFDTLARLNAGRSISTDTRRKIITYFRVTRPPKPNLVFEPDDAAVGG